MNYRHAFHAGNFADVFKHVLLTRLLRYLVRKDAPLCYIDTHAGPGRYDLSGEIAERTGEWREGIARLAAARLPPDLADLLAPYLTALGVIGAAPPTAYLGSPLLAQRLMRPDDRLLLNELRAEDAAALREVMGRDPRAHVSERDGYAALKALVPPRERRGLVLIDPPYEEADEFARLEQGLGDARRRWATGVYALWYPIKDPAFADAFAGRVMTDRSLRLELMVGRMRPGRHARPALIGCGMVVINPTYGLQEEASRLLPMLAATLAPAGAGAWRVDSGEAEALVTA